MRGASVMVGLTFFTLASWAQDTGVSAPFASPSIAREVEPLDTEQSHLSRSARSAQRGGFADHPLSPLFGRHPGRRLIRNASGLPSVTSSARTFSATSFWPLHFMRTPATSAADHPVVFGRVSVTGDLRAVITRTDSGGETFTCQCRGHGDERRTLQCVLSSSEQNSPRFGNELKASPVLGLRT